MSRWSALLLALALIWSSDASAVPRRTPLIRGMTVSCHGWGQAWGTPAMREATHELADLGVEWIAIHPYGAIRRDGSIEFDDPFTTDYLLGAVKNAGGLKIFWTPHIAHWGTFEWRGSIDFGDDREAWKRFFSDYEGFIVAQARFAEANRIPLFSVGIEYEKTMAYEAEWRRIIDAVRRVYRGRITYAANWDGIDRVPFWDAVDLIGVQAYFPLGSDLQQGWSRVWEQLERLSRKYGNKKILFNEIGFARSKKAASEPWLPDNDEDAIDLRTRLLEAAFDEIEHPLLEGAFWWKWIPGNRLWDRDFSMRDPEAIRALTAHWKKR